MSLHPTSLLLPKSIDLLALLEHQSMKPKHSMDERSLVSMPFYDATGFCVFKDDAEILFLDANNRFNYYFPPVDERLFHTLSKTSWRHRRLQRPSTEIRVINGMEPVLFGCSFRDCLDITGTHLDQNLDILEGNFRFTQIFPHDANERRLQGERENEGLQEIPFFTAPLYFSISSFSQSPWPKRLSFLNFTLGQAPHPHWDYFWCGKKHEKSPFRWQLSGVSRDWPPLLFVLLRLI